MVLTFGLTFALSRHPPDPLENGSSRAQAPSAASLPPPSVVLKHRLEAYQARLDSRERKGRPSSPAARSALSQVREKVEAAQVDDANASRQAAEAALDLYQAQFGSE